MGIVLINTMYVLLLLWYRHHWLRAGFILPDKLKEDELPRVSVIVPVRNETENLNLFLEQISMQNFPVEMVEWIFVDDQSDDGSLQILNGYSKSKITVLSLSPSEGKGKKFALKKGIENAKGIWMLTTDADCSIDKNWIRTLVEYGEFRNADMVCGTVQVKANNNFLHNFQAMETGILQLSGVGSLSAGYPLLNTGASLAFKKEAWKLVQGYSAHVHIASGDDTFLMLSMHQQKELKVIACPNVQANVSTHPVNSWRQILNQRLRWNGKVKHYPIGYIHAVGAIVFLSAFSFVYLFICGWMGASLETLMIIFSIRFITEYMLLTEWQNFIGKKFSVIHIFLMSIIYPLFTVFSMVFRPFVKSDWKGRTCE
ncbi:MAG: glycosyltransferase [Bacteroidetes bacterium]|nr:glycosyltransferase [Bacteroidota bacterium]